MKKSKGKKTLDKERLAEDWCFCCKDGGELLICDYKECLKAYHCQCVGKDDSFISSAKRWSCDWHKCSSCHKASKFHCVCCPIAVCNSCASNQHFVQIKGKYGMCTHCLKLSLLIEENKDVDSDGEHVDFSSRDTMEGLFKEYYDLKRETLGLNSKVLRLAKTRLSMGRNYPSDSDVDQYDEVGEKHLSSDDDSIDDSEGERRQRKRKRSKGERSSNRKKGRSSKMEFNGWASKSLIQFLSSIDKDISESLSQQEVTSIINDYIRRQNLHDPKMKKRILCDEYLQSIFGRKVIRKNRIKDLLEAHFYENREESEDEEDEMECDIEMDNYKGKAKREREAPKNERERSIPQSSFAAIVADNIRLVYLTRSLIYELHKQHELFDNKITGCFVRVKAHPHDIYQRNSHLLMQVTGVKQAVNDGKQSDSVLLVSEFPGEIPISTLSDCDFKEEELEDLTRRVNAGLLRKPTVVELEKKARILHKDITIHWINKEMKLLKNKIDLANEKGWRQQLFECRERRNLLQTQSEQDRLLNRIPSVVPAVEEVESDRVEDKKVGQVNSTAPADTLISPGSLPDVEEVGSGCDEDNKTDQVESSAPANTLTSPRSLSGVEELNSVSDKDDKSNPGESLVPGNAWTSSPNLPDLEEAKSVRDEDGKIDQRELPSPTNTLTCPRSLPDVDSICDEDNKSKLRESPTPNYSQTSPRSLSDLEELKFSLDEDNKTDKGESRTPENTWTSHRSLQDVEDVESHSDEDIKTDQVPANKLISPSSLPDVKEITSDCDKDDKTKLGNLPIPDNAQTGSLNLPDQEEAKSFCDKDNKTDEEESPTPKTILTSRINYPDEIEVGYVHDEHQTNQGESPTAKFSQIEVQDDALLQKTFQQATSEGGHSMGGCSHVEAQPEKTILSTCSSRTKLNVDACFGEVMPNDMSVGTIDVINLSSDDDDDGENRSSGVLVGEPNDEDNELHAWHICGIPGKKSKTFRLSMLREWSELSPEAKKFKVWKDNQTEEDAILLADAIKLAIPRG